MEIVLWVSFAAVVGAISLILAKSDVAAVLHFVSVFLVSSVLLIAFLLNVSDHHASTYDVKTSVVYYGMSAPQELASFERILESSQYLWLSRFRYKVNCNQIANGCPENWPKKFKFVETVGKKLIIVPVN